MTAEECGRVGELTPELALGIADGEERARALDHLADCPECRQRLERLSVVADELLLLAPAQEPPAGFEQRAAARINPAPRSPRSRRRFGLALAGAAAAAALAAGAVWLALADDRELAASYRETLAVANGEYFDAAPLEVPGGEKIGYVYGYQGRASWVLAVVYDRIPDGSYRLELATHDGRMLSSRRLEIADGEGSIGTTIPVDYHELAELRLLDDRGREVAESELR